MSGVGAYISHMVRIDRVGVAILIKKKSNVKVTEVLTDKEGRYIVLIAEYEGAIYTLCNLYGPNTDQPQFFSRSFWNS